MSAPVFDPVAVAEVLRRWLSSRLNAAAVSWLEDRLDTVAAGDRKALYLAFGLTVRKTGKADLEPTAAELADSANVRPGWNPRGWTVDQAARVLLVLRYPAEDEQQFVETLDQLFAAGEVHELVALYQGLPLYPHQEALALRCAEGQRTNIQPVFRAIAHRNARRDGGLGRDRPRERHHDQAKPPHAAPSSTFPPPARASRRSRTHAARIPA